MSSIPCIPDSPACSDPNYLKASSLYPYNSFHGFSFLNVYTLLVVLSTYPNHFGTPLSALSYILILLPNQSLTSSIRTQSTILTQHPILKHFISNTSSLFHAILSKAHNPASVKHCPRYSYPSLPLQKAISLSTPFLMHPGL